MQFPWVIVVLAAAVASVAISADDHPVVSVIELLKNLKETADQEGKAEELTFVKFERWCANSGSSLTKAIAVGKESIDELESTISAKAAQEKTLTTQIAGLGEEIVKYQAASLEATNERETAAALYTTADQDTASTITAIANVLDTLQENQEAMGGAMLQTKLQKLLAFPMILEKVSDEQRAALISQARGEPMGGEAMGGEAMGGEPTAAAPAEVLAKGDAAAHEKTYKFKSGTVIELLKELKMKFEDDKVEGTKEETASQNAYSLTKQAQDAAEQAATDSKTQKSTTLGEVQGDLSQAKTDLSDTVQTLQADSDNLDSTKKSCNEKRSEWAERSTIRENEMKAMDAAIQILADVTGVRTEAPSNPVLPASPLEATLLSLNVTLPKDSKMAALVQDIDADPKMKAVNLIRQQARAAHSKQLAQFAEEVAAHLTGPFDEVNNMIQKMLFRLMAEQKDEDEHKNWCDLEMSKTNASETDKQNKISELNLKIQDNQATAALLAEDINTASEMVATLTSHMAEATEIREAGKEENALAISDAKRAQEALSKATAVLTTFYKDSGMVAKESFELLQQKIKQPVELSATPETWASSYSGVANPEDPSGVVTLLKTVSADFARMEADTEAQEEIDQKAFDAEIKSCEVEKARTGKEAEMKADEQKRTLEKVATLEKSLKHTSEQLEAVQQYWKDLSPACMEGDSTYEDRKASRDAEISALKEAQVILKQAFDGAAEPAPAASFLAPVKPVTH